MSLSLVMSRSVPQAVPLCSTLSLSAVPLRYAGCHLFAALSCLVDWNWIH